MLYSCGLGLSLKPNPSISEGAIAAARKALRERKIPYRMVGAQSFYDRKEVKDSLAYVALFDDPEADAWEVQDDFPGEDEEMFLPPEWRD